MPTTKLLFYPGVTEAVAPAEPELDLATLVKRQADLLQEWAAFGSDLKRRLYNIPFDLALEAEALIQKTDKITNYQLEDD